MNQENLPVLIERPSPNNVNYPIYRRRASFFVLVANLYFLMRDYPDYGIGQWFPIIYHWAVRLASTPDGLTLRDDLFVDIFYHGVAYTQRDAFGELRAMLL